MNRLTIGNVPWDCGTYTPERAKRLVGTDDEGNPIIEKFPWAPHALLLDMAGNVRRFVLTNGASDRSADNPYGKHNVGKMLRAGALKYHDCPLTDESAVRWLPKDLRGQHPCKAGTYGAKAGPCPHVLEVEKRRKAANAEKARKEVDKLKSWDQKAYELKQTETAAVVERLNELTNGVAAGEKPSGRKG